jgi:hypothetical protein
MNPEKACPAIYAGWTRFFRIMLEERARSCIVNVIRPNFIAL